MHSIEFKTEIIDGIIKVPQEYKNFQDAYVQVAITIKKDSRKDIKTRLNDNIQSLDFSGCKADCFKGVNPVDYQRKIRDEK